jgi:hypothetical protein
MQRRFAMEGSWKGTVITRFFGSRCLLVCGAVLIIGGSVAHAQQAAPAPQTQQQTVPNDPRRQGRQPQGSATSKQIRRAANIKLGPPKSGPKITNPQATKADAAVLAVLQKQRQAVDSLAAQMKAAQLVGNAPVQSQPASGSATAARAQTSKPLNKAGAAPTIAPGKVSDAPGTPSSSFARLSQVDLTVVTCTHDPSMRILKVSGDAAPATFTSEERYNFYTITGCSFGDPGPNAKVYIYNRDIFHQEFQVQEWNENWIKINLHSHLNGLLDQDNLTLVVQRADGKQASKSGFKFYAARETTRLTHIPRSSFSLNQFTLSKTSSLSVLYTSPSSATVEPKFAGWTAEVKWTSSDPATDKIDPGEDIYQFKQLQPGFTPDSAQMGSVDLDCGEYQFINLGGSFGLKWVGDDLHVIWQAQYCKPVGCGGFSQADCFQSPPSSNYAVNVWVTGPRGVSPWPANLH